MTERKTSAENVADLVRSQVVIMPVYMTGEKS
jgi:hypothetical protein